MKEQFNIYTNKIKLSKWTKEKGKEKKRNKIVKKREKSVGEYFFFFILPRELFPTPPEPKKTTR